MQKKEIYDLFKELFNINVLNENYREFEFKKKFEKKILKLKGQEAYNIFNKVLDILKNEDLSRYKNLKYSLKSFKRVHVNNSYVIIFYDDVTKKIHFVDYEHHDKIYIK